MFIAIPFHSGNMIWTTHTFKGNVPVRYMIAKLLAGEVRVVQRWLESLPETWPSKDPMIGFTRTGVLLVTCTGLMVLNYNGELRNRSLADQTYRVKKSGGDWKVCGYRSAVNPFGVEVRMLSGAIHRLCLKHQSS
jgi:hypothetical protein